MYTLETLKKQVTAAQWNKANDERVLDRIQQLNVNMDQYPVIRLHGLVQIDDYGYYNSKQIYEISIHDFKNEIVETRLQRYAWGYCEISAMTYWHVAILKEFLLARKNHTLDFNDTPEVQTNDALKKYLNRFSKVKLSDQSGDVYLQAFIAQTSYGEPNLSVEFRIGRTGTKGYVLKSIETLCAAIRNSDKLRYGKNLEFVPSMESFEESSRPLLKFFLELTNRNNYYVQDYDAPQSAVVGRTLSLSGQYLDRFLEILPEDMLYSGTMKSSVPIFVLDDFPQITSQIYRTEGTFAFEINSLDYFEGEEYVYALSWEDNILYRTERTDELMTLLKMAKDIGNEELYINEADLPQFVKGIVPAIQANGTLRTDDVDLASYLPPKPAFEMYLDMPQDGWITCKVKAVYGDQSYNIFDEKKNVDKRNLDEEQQMQGVLGKWFTAFNPEDQSFSLNDNDQKLYSLVNEGIPFFQTFATVYASDAIKRLNAHKLSHVTFGVSIEHDLLQLELAGEQKTLEELAEILSRYEPKKKYYRLKNGDLIHIDDEHFDALAEMTQDLQLSKKAIENGEVELPMYRAMYLDTVAGEEIDIARDKHFRELVNRVKKIDESQFEVPSEVSGILREYQKDGYQWMKTLQENGFAGLLADEMGLGKSLQIITLLLSMEKRGRCLIVCPASLVYNWDAEFKKFAPQLPTVMLAGNAGERAELIQHCAKDAILITSYDALKRDIDLYTDMHFDVEVIDEAQYIKNANTQAATSVKEIQATFRMALTGTPIENRLSELWSIFDYLLPGFLYSYNRFRRTYENAIVKNKDEGTRNKLRKMIAPFILRRLKSEVLKDLPDKLEEVMYAPLEGEQKELYEARAQRLRINLARQSAQDFNENKMKILAEITKLRQTCCDPSLLYESYHGNSAKEEMCLDLIERAIDEGHKILLFSQFKTMLDHLIVRLEEKGITYHYLNGQTPKGKRAEMVEQFQKDEVPIFLISLKAGGTGLNLTAADIVIHYDPWWNTAVENQATDRAHRIGQENVVSVYRLIMKDTIEERIVALQESKADLAGEILSGDEMSASSLTKEQLLEIL